MSDEQPPYCCAGHATDEQIAAWKRRHPEQFEAAEDGAVAPITTAALYTSEA
jgi:hypothetical protein